jgi:hypothetical protein
LQFANSWERQQKRCLAPTLDAGGEALVNLFWNTCFRNVDREKVTPKKMSMLLRRDEFLSPHFSLCLNTYICKMEQDRGMRASTYKVMNNVNNTNIQSLNSLYAFFREKAADIDDLVVKALAESQGDIFSEVFIDWVEIARQLPMYHREYDHANRKEKDVRRGYAI